MEKRLKHKSKGEVRKERKTEFYQESWLRRRWYSSIKFRYDLSGDQSSHDLSVFQSIYHLAL